MRPAAKKILDSCTGCGATDAAVTYWQTIFEGGQEVADEFKHTCGAITRVPR